MGNCKDCKWWTVGETRDGTGICELTRLAKDKVVHPGTKAIASADYNGYLETMPDFGCVQFEPIETTNERNPPPAR